MVSPWWGTVNPNQNSAARRGTPRLCKHLVNRVFKPATRAAGIPELTVHDVCHTGASLMIGGRPAREGDRRADGPLGRRRALVLRRYGHLYKDARQQAAIALESHVFGPAQDSAVGTVRDEGRER